MYTAHSEALLAPLFRIKKTAVTNSGFHYLCSLITKDILKHMNIKVLGTGCSTCKSLEKTTKEAVAELGIEASITKEEDIVKIMEYGVMRTPALVINGEVAVSGRIPSVKEIIEILTS